MSKPDVQCLYSVEGFILGIFGSVLIKFRNVIIYTCASPTLTYQKSALKKASFGENIEIGGSLECNNTGLQCEMLTATFQNVG